MGIAALLQALEAAMGEVDMEALRGKCVAVDGYCWLHKVPFEPPPTLIIFKLTHHTTLSGDVQLRVGTCAGRAHDKIPFFLRGNA